MRVSMPGGHTPSSEPDHEVEHSPGLPPMTGLRLRREVIEGGQLSEPLPLPAGTRVVVVIL